MPNPQKKIEKLYVLERIADESLNKAILNLAQIKSELTNARERLGLLEKYLEDYKQKILLETKQGLLAQKVKQHQTFLQNLTLSVGRQNEHIYKLKQAVEAATHVYSEAYSKKELLVKIIDKRKTDLDLFNEKKIVKEQEAQLMVQAIKHNRK